MGNRYMIKVKYQCFIKNLKKLKKYQMGRFTVGTGRQKRCCQRVGLAREVSSMYLGMKIGPCGKIECTERLINS